MYFTVIDKEYLGTTYGHDRYKIEVSGDLSYFDGFRRTAILDACDANNYGGYIERWYYNAETDTTTFYVELFID